jgi:misacylated tRNA(Ala) deacylase
MATPATLRLYWADDHTLTADSIVVAIDGPRLALRETCFYPGGGGQPCDQGTITVGAHTISVTAIEADSDSVLWHLCAEPPPPHWLGARVSLQVDPARRSAFAAYHTVLHLLNTIAQRHYSAWMTGAQIGLDYARIDFKWDGFSPAVCAEVQARVNAEIEANRPLRAYSLPAEEFAQRPELLRTLEVKPPVIDGQVRVVEITGFDAQACGGTHLPTTGELGRFVITRTDNKGKINRRFYVRLDPPSA